VSPRWTRWRTHGAAALSGILFALAFPPVGAVVLLPLAFVPWLVALGGEASRLRALLSGFVFGLAFWCASIPWIVYVVTHYGGQNAVMGVVCLVILALILAEWPALVGFATAAAAPAGSPVRLAVFPVLWAASEHARAVVYKGFPWNLTGHALFRHPIWMQTASVWGVVGLGGVVATVAALLAAAARSRRLLPLAGAAALTLAAGGWGAARLVRAVPSGGPLSVALLQPNQTEEMRATPEGAARSYAEVVGLARDAGDRLPGLIVIPESAFPLYWERSDRLRQDLAGIAHDGPSILFNDVAEEGDRYFNAARLLTPHGLAGAPYRKVHLVPFGEYVPLPRLFFFVRQISTEIGAFSAADSPEIVRSGPLAIGVGICYEILYPSLARRETAAGANLLATISNDSWYGRAGAQEQHFAGAVLRSVEDERWLLRAAITGISGIVDPRGRITAESAPDTRAIVYGTVRLVETRTAWTRWGWRLPGVADAAALLVLTYGLVRLVRDRRPRGARAGR
jgi:apolipoprotein N-acyltransferase